jgi:hypothetical protein
VSRFHISFDKMTSVRLPSVIEQVRPAEAVKESQWATPLIYLILESGNLSRIPDPVVQISKFKCVEFPYR